MRTARWQESAAFGTAAAVVLVAAALPLVWLAAQAVVASVPADGRLVPLFGRTVALAAAVTAATLAIGVPLGLLVGRTDVAGRGVALVIHAFPVFLPPFLLALGWFHLFGRHGLAGSAASSRLLFSTAGVVAVETLTFTPIVTALTALAVRGIDPSIVDAARMTARPVRVAVRILLPLAAPGIALAAILVFALSLSELGVPMFLRVPVYAGAVFARLGGSASPGEAFALTLPLLGMALFLVAAERRLAGRRSLAALGLRRDAEPLRLGRWRGVVTVAAWGFALLSVAPFVGLLWRARSASLDTVRAWIGDSVETSLLTGCAAASIVTVAGVVLGRALARRRTAAGITDGITLLAFMTPAAALGTGLIAVWNRPATAAVYATIAIVVVGYVARYAIVGLRPLAVAFAQEHPNVEEAAACAGAGWGRRMARIVLPLHARAIAATWLLVLVFSLRDLETAVLYYPPGGETLPVRILALEANGPEPVVAALALLHTAITAAAVALGLMLVVRRPR